MNKHMPAMYALRAAVRMFDSCRESFLIRFSRDELLKLFDAYAACGFDIRPDAWTEHQIERALAGETDLFDSEGEPIVKYHYVYGSGQPGCMYDNGPHAVETLMDAVESALFIFQDLDEEQIDLATELLTRDLIHYFPKEVREQAGASYIEISRVDGPMPEGEE